MYQPQIDELCRMSPTKYYLNPENTWNRGLSDKTRPFCSVPGEDKRSAPSEQSLQ